MPKSLVTGGAGFIGAHVVNELLKLGHEVVVLDDLSGGFEDNVNSKAIFVKGSIVDSDCVNRLFEDHNFDYIYHLAAYAAEGLSHFIRVFNYTNNLIGSMNLLNKAVNSKVKCFIFTSSIAVYGALEPPMREVMVPEPEDPYGIAKLAVEYDLKAANKMFGLNYIIFRPHNVFGEYQNLGDKYRNVVGIFMNQLMQNKPLTIFGDGSQTRAFSYIGDVAPYIANSVNVKEAYNNTFNVGADNPYTVNQLAKTAMDVMNISGDIQYVASRNEVLHAHSDHTKIKKVFGETSALTLEEGMQKMAKWAKGVGIRKSKKFKNIEVMQNLPPVWLKD